MSCEHPLGMSIVRKACSACWALCSSFYGLLDLLSGTELNPGQSEIGMSNTQYPAAMRIDSVLVQTAKQSCDLLLKVWDPTNESFDA